MIAITKKEAALLGLLSEQSMHAYQIEKTVEYRDMRSWTEISMSTIYKTLRKLEDSGLVESTVSLNEKNVAQKQYQITETGIQALRTYFFEILEVVEPVKWQIDVALYNLPVVSPDEAAATLEKYKANLKNCISQYKDLENFLKAEGCQGFVQAVAIRPQYLYKAEIKWVESFIQQINNEGASWNIQK